MIYRPRRPKCRGRYFLDIIDDTKYSTDSFELYSLYYRMFYPDIYYETDRIVTKKESPGEPATQQDLLSALQEEKRIYDCGYVPKLVWIKDKRGKTWRKTRWVEDLKKSGDIIVGAVK